MGKNNKQRRARRAKDRARNRSHSGAHNGAHGGTGNGTEHRAEYEPRSGFDDAWTSQAERDLARSLERELLRQVSSLWNYGWLPAELIRQIRRDTSVDGERLIAAAVAADHHRRDRSTLHPLWVAHFDGLELPPVSGAQGWVDEIYTARLVLQACMELVSLPVIVPPPGSSDASPSMVDLRGQATSNPVLEKVRGLLAQAESTNFEAEAEAFTAKAQELMARHAIDAAMVWGRSARDEQPVTIRIPIDEPYVNAKSLLLHHVAKHSRCRAVFHTGYAMSSVVGFESDVAATETLFTSLLVQAQAALGRAATSAPPGSQTRSRSFRSSFLVSYATRIGQRLAQINEHVLADAQATATGGSSLLPVLADRSSAIDDAVDQQFGRLSSGPVRRSYDLAGWAAGSEAADRARLSLADLPAPAA